MYRDREAARRKGVHMNIVEILKKDGADAHMVRFNGQRYVFLKNDKGGGTLTRPEVLGETMADVMLHMLTGISYAAVNEDGEVVRYGRHLGYSNEFEYE
jgi:hypothetical protein